MVGGGGDPGGRPAGDRLCDQATDGGGLWTADDAARGSPRDSLST